MLLVLYALTIFTSATLLFLIQPMFARMVLPLLGGSPSVWNTAMVFYQSMLLAGYAYAHLTTRWLGLRRQAALHAALLLLPLLTLPIGVPAGWAPPAASSPIPWLLALMVVAVGLPFFVVSASSPLLQVWFSGSGHRGAADPYFLYAASNVGSMIALLGYPALVEPRLRLAEQSRLWAAGYGLLLLLTLACAAMLWRPGRRAGEGQGGAALPAAPQQSPISALRRARWVLLAFVPSSLMLSVTTYLTTNIAAIPLLWVVPLAIYLLTFILVFARRPPLPHQVMIRALPILLLPLVIAIMAQANSPLAILLPLHLLAFFAIAMVAHGELARDRPAAAHLTEFYLWMSVGGALGGVCNALLAPLLFSSVLEYPLALVLACLLMPPVESGKPAGHGEGWGEVSLPKRFALQPIIALDIVLPAALGLATAAAILAAQAADLPGPAALAVMFGLPALVCFSFSRRPLRFGLGVAALLLASALYTGEQGRLIYAERSFFGIHRVLVDPSGRFHYLLHSGTLHGVQSLNPAYSREPLAYYYASGPIGQIFAAYDRAAPRQRVGAVGMGVGSIACYRQPGQAWTFYEIDPAVEQLARDRRFFSFIPDCAPDAAIVLGDARLNLARSQAQYDLLVLDAYSSDSIPVHLVTREALALYLDRLAPGGIMAFHISNRHLDLRPVLAALAHDAGLAGLVQNDDSVSAEEQQHGKWVSEWLVMARAEADLAPLADDPRWARLDPAPDTPLWTDDFSSLLSVLRR